MCEPVISAQRFFGVGADWRVCTNEIPNNDMVVLMTFHVFSYALQKVSEYSGVVSILLRTYVLEKALSPKAFKIFCNEGPPIHNH